MNKIVRKAVRTFLVKNNKIVAIKYKTGENKDYFDMIGGKIEKGESPVQTSIREYKEETGIDIISQRHKGYAKIEYPERIFEFDIFIVDEYKGEPQEFEENYSMWVDIETLLNEQKILPSVEILKYLNKDDINLKIYSNTEHNILKIINM